MKVSIVDNGIILSNGIVTVRVNRKKINYVISVDTETGEVKCLVRRKDVRKFTSFLHNNADSFETVPLDLVSEAFVYRFVAKGKIKLTLS